MRKIVTKGLNTVMEGMFSGTVFTGSVEMNEPLEQDKSKRLQGLCADGHGNEGGLVQDSRTAPAFYEELGCRLKFSAWQRIISHRKQCQAAWSSETRK